MSILMSYRQKISDRSSRRDQHDKPFDTYLGVHLGGGKSLDDSDSLGGSLLESASVESLMHVESIVSASVLHNFLLSVLNSGHFV